MEKSSEKWKRNGARGPWSHRIWRYHAVFNYIVQRSNATIGFQKNLSFCALSRERDRVGFSNSKIGFIRVFKVMWKILAYLSHDIKSSLKFLDRNLQISFPIGSMYAIYGNIYHQYTPNVSIYTIHGSYGFGFASLQVVCSISSVSSSFSGSISTRSRISGRSFCLSSVGITLW